MAIPKVMGIETEYGITVKNQPDFNPILSSLLLINSYETYRSSRVRWDYEAESPLRDARGFEYMEEKEGTSKEESRLINLILSNGARFYVDHAHPEYSSPETTNPRDEPHADPEKYRRLHVIVGDANMSEVANYLKVGTMAIVLSMVEDDFIDRDFSLDSPVLAFRKVSRDLACREPIRLKDGRTITAVDVQREFLELAQRYYHDREKEGWVADVLARWEHTLDRLAEDPR